MDVNGLSTAQDPPRKLKPSYYKYEPESIKTGHFTYEEDLDK